MNHSAQHTHLNTLKRVIWAAFLFTLPVTSFPYFPPAIGGEALVRPLFFYLLILIVLFALPWRLHQRPFAREFVPLLVFVLIALATSLLSLMRGIEPLAGVSTPIRVFRGLITLGIGCSIYFVVALIPETVEDLRFTLRWMYAGMAVAMLWGSLQATYILHYDAAWFEWLDRMQRFVSIRGLLVDRISGLTYEPHWFASQLTLLVLPWVLASVLSGYSVFPKWGKYPMIEWFLLAWSVVLLPFTYSRSGVLIMVIVVFLSFLIFRLINTHEEVSQSHRVTASQVASPKAGVKKPISRLSSIVKRSIEVGLALILVLLPIYAVGSRNPFFARLWEYAFSERKTVQGYLNYLGLDARIAYSEAAFSMYEEYPILGVGVGNYAFYFEEMLPDRPLAAVPELLRIVTPEKGRDRLITSKNLYFRLLAETGIVGMVAFLAFIASILGCALYLWFSRQAEQGYWGMACLSSLIAFTLSAFAFDSFVIPNMWVIFGIISAAARLFRYPHLERQTIL